MNPEKRREDFFDFASRLARAKQDPNFEKVKRYTLNKYRLAQSGQEEIFPPGVDLELETLTNFLLWEQGQLELDDVGE